MGRILIAAAGAVMALVGPASVEAGPVAPSKPSQFVVLQRSGTGTCNFLTKPFDQQLNPDGTTTAFSVPAKQVLVVTSYDAESSTTANRNVVVSLVDNGLGVFEDSLLTDATGFGVKSGPVGNLVVKSGSTLCGAVGGGGAITVHGFLTADK
jgi:hypothetical protein